MAKPVRLPGLSRLELAVMERLWGRGALPIRELQESFPAARRPAYTTVQTIVYRLEAKQAVRRVRKIGNAHIFAAAVTREGAHRRLLDQVLGLFGGRIAPVMAHWVEAGRVAPDDLREAERTLRRLSQARREAPARKGRKP